MVLLSGGKHKSKLSGRMDPFTMLVLTVFDPHPLIRWETRMLGAHLNNG